MHYGTEHVDQHGTTGTTQCYNANAETTQCYDANAETITHCYNANAETANRDEVEKKQTTTTLMIALVTFQLIYNTIETSALICEMMSKDEYYRLWDETKYLLAADKGKRTWRDLPDQVKMRLKHMFKTRRGLTIDSGAADSVFPTSWIKKILIRASKGSKAGLYYLAASNTKIFNDGEFLFKIFTKEGHRGNLLFQCAETNKPLCSVSHLTDEDYCVVFNKHEGRDVSYLMHKPSKRIMKLRRERGVYVLDTWTEDEITPFTRPS